MVQKTQEWQIEVIFANLDSDQNANTGKTFSANLIIQEKFIPTMVADICESGDNLASCIAEFNTLAGDGADNIYYHDGIGSYINADQEAEDNSYRYSGGSSKVNNYVCFGTDEETCPEDNLYRIIGIFDDDSNGTYQAKLIKSTSYGGYAWDTDSNIWDTTTKPDIYYTLNETYYNSLGLEWQNLIEEHTWQVGGFNGADLGTAKETYDIEVGIDQSGYVETMKIGLMYVSDYGYGGDPERWIMPLDTDYFARFNWLESNDFAWFISRMADSPDGVFWEWYYSMNVSVYSVDRSTTATRPTFYLEPTVTISSGTGTSSDPFILLTN